MKDVRITESMRGADCWTDHRMIRSKLSLTVHQPHRKTSAKPSKQLNVRLLQDPSVRHQLAENLTEKLSQIPDCSNSIDINADWAILRDTISTAAIDTLGVAKRKHQDWFDENDAEIKLILEKKQQLHRETLLPSSTHATHALYRNACHEAQAKLRTMRDKWWDARATETQAYADRHETKEFYASLKAIYGPKHSTVVPVLAADNSTMLTSKSDILLRWQQHFSSLLNANSSVADSALAELQQLPVFGELDAEPTATAVATAINALKNGKAPGADAIPAEVYKHGGTELAHKLHCLFIQIWKHSIVPQDFKDATIVTIYKRKGNKSDCGNYRGISLLSIAGKILTRIILDRLLRFIADKVLPETQCGFRSSRGTADMIFSARQLQEKSREQHMNLYTVFIDLTKAFDTVNRVGLWKVLSKFGCTDKFVAILRSLHDGMHGRVRVDGSLSESFPITNGVRQGCIVGPVLFNLFYAAMLMDATRDLKVGVNIRFRTSGKLFNLARLRSSTKVLEELIHELLYADDCALEAHSLADIQEITDRFAASAERYGLSINLAKTEVMFQPAPGTPYSDPKVKIGGTLLKAVTSFCYLGSTLCNDVSLDKEITNRISKASSSFGRLYDRVWSQHGIKLLTKIKVFKAVVLSNLLYGCETWTCYRRHIKELDKFHLRHLRSILGIKWQDKVTNIEVLERCQCTGIEVMIATAQLRWTGHIARMSDTRLPKQLLYGELSSGKRSQGGQRKRFKDSLKNNLKRFDIDTGLWESAAADRSRWRTAIREGSLLFESNRRRDLSDKRLQRKHRETEARARPPATSSDFICAQCGKDCHSRIGLFSHNRTHWT